MSQTIRFVLALHNHQPIGNFTGVMEQAYQESYRPFLDVFERYPTLKIVLGHMGEAVPYWLYRIDYMYNVYTSRSTSIRKIQRKPSEYVKDNFLITTSGVNFHPTLKYCHEVLGPENIMFAIDYPYQESKEAAHFMQTAPLPVADMEKMTHGNAERIFHITPPAAS